MAKNTIASQAYEVLKRKILFLELELGAVLNETELMDQLKLGRSPIRDAMHRLKQEGLIQILPRQGTLVSDISLSSFHEVFEFRLHNEGFAAYLAVKRGDPRCIKELEALLVDAEQLPSNTNAELSIEIDTRFHQIIYRASANRYLAKTLNELLNHSIRLANLARTRSATVYEEIPDYRAIYECFVAKDPEEARTWMESHVLESQERIQNALEVLKAN